MAADGVDRSIATERWTNWSGSARAEPISVLRPADEAELRAAVTGAAGPIRVVGAGHSFTPLVSTEGAIVSLDRMGASHRPLVRDVDRAASTAWIAAGARLYDLSPALEDDGLAFKNLGDINQQSFAGATATGTHGTGRAFPCLSAEIQAIRLMTADGEILEASLESDPDLVRAAQVGLGALGVLIEAKAALKPSYKLHRRTWATPLEESLAAAERLWETHRNFEFFVIPFAGSAINLTHDETDAAPTERPPSTDEEALQMLRKIRDWFGWSRTLRAAALRWLGRRIPEENAVDLSWRLLASQRVTLFNEMEYHLPVDGALDVVREVVATVERTRRDVFFPIEVRRTAGDEAWLSPFQGGPRVSVAIHTLAEADHGWFFTSIEPIFRRAGGRPHWGKLHSLTAPELEALYPDFDRFRALRRRLDPQGRFLNAHLAALIGEAMRR